MSQVRDCFVYGELDPAMVEAVVGHEPDHAEALLKGFQLCVQATVDMPPQAQAILANSRTPEELDRFRAYGAVPIMEGPVPDLKHVVRGLVLRGLTELDMALLDNWNIEGLLFHRRRSQSIEIVTDGGNILRTADVHILPEGKYTVFDEPYDGTFPPPLNEPGSNRERARATRERFIAEQQT